MAREHTPPAARSVGVGRVEGDTWRAMGADVQVTVVNGPDDAVTIARRRIDELESRWSRFRPDSDISRMNRRAGRATVVHPDTRRLVRLAIEAWRITGGLVNATILGDVTRAGYDRPFESWPGNRRAAPTSELQLVACTDIQIDDTAGTITLPSGTGFDPGGIGKGLAADMVSSELMAAGAAGTFVGLGGDVRVAGVGPGGAGWTVAIEDPPRTGNLAVVGVAGGAVATSTTARRRWLVDGAVRHHLIDPRTGRPSNSGLVQVTVIAAETWFAESLAKASLLRGSGRAFDLLPDGVPALVVDDDGHLAGNEALTPYLGGRPLTAVPATTAIDRSGTRS